MIVGLGNPGVQYDHTRHNVGFRIIEFLVNGGGLSDKNSDWSSGGRIFSERGRSGGTLNPIDSWRTRWQARVLESSIDAINLSSSSTSGCGVVFLLPQTFMNLSGESVGSAWRWYNKGLHDFSRLLVVHDEVDLPFGRLQLKQGGGEAGHNGLKSISEVLGSKNYIRLRVGVGRPDNIQKAKILEKPEDGGVKEGLKENGAVSLASWVLAKFSQDEERLLPEIFERAGAGIRCWLKLAGKEESGKDSAVKTCQQLLNSKAFVG